MHKILFYNKFIIRLYMFRAQRAHHQEVKIVLYSVMIPDAVQYNFDLLMMSTKCSKHVQAYNKLIIKQDFVH